jgi:hypothetical protein
MHEDHGRAGNRERLQGVEESGVLHRMVPFSLGLPAARVERRVIRD